MGCQPICKLGRLLVFYAYIATVFLKIWFLGHQHQHHLQCSQKCKVSYLGVGSKSGVSRLVLIDLPGSVFPGHLRTTTQSKKKKMHPQRRKNHRVVWKWQELSSVDRVNSVHTVSPDWRLRGHAPSCGPEPSESLIQVCSPNYYIRTITALRLEVLPLGRRQLLCQVNNVKT